MHYRLLVTFNKTDAETSLDAREHVKDELENDASFCGEGGRFKSPVCDWFVIGGRWSGELSETTFMKDVIKKIQELEQKKDLSIRGTHYGDKTKQEEQAKLKTELEKLYQEALPKEYQGKGLTFDRDSYNHSGYEDDAMIVNQELYDALLKEFEGQDEGSTKQEYNGSTWEDLHFVDLDYDPVSKDFIGKKWIVVVDYHN